MISLVEGSAFSILEQVEEGNGLEAYRKLSYRSARNKLQNAVLRMASIVNIKFQDSNFENAFTDWESEIFKLDTSLGPSKRLPDEVKIGILVAATTGKIHDPLCVSMARIETYSEAKETVINYLKST